MTFGESVPPRAFLKIHIDPAKSAKPWLLTHGRPCWTMNLETIPLDVECYEKEVKTLALLGCWLMFVAEAAS